MYRTKIALTALIALGVSHGAFALDHDHNAVWDGSYVGAFAGYGWGETDVDTTGQVAANVNNVAGGARPANVSLDTDGMLGGVAVGYNWQMNDWVLGLEADIAATGIDEKRRVNTTALNGVDRLANDFESSLDYLGTARARVGYVFNQTMVYGTGGLAYGGVENEVNMFGPAGQLQFTGKKDSNELGYALGGGVEHAINDRWNVTASYLYYDLGEQTVAANVVAGSGGGGTGYNSKFDNSGNIVRAGFGYSF